MAEPAHQLLRTIIASIVTTLWTVSYIIDMVNPHYDPNPGITPVMAAVVVWLFGGEVLKRKNGGSS